MTKAREKADGLPFRLYERIGKFVVSYGYKLPDGTWAFRLSAQKNNTRKAAEIRTEAIYQANLLNGAAPVAGSMNALFDDYFKWQRSLPRSSEDRKADNTLKENQSEAKRLMQTFGKVSPSSIKPVHIYKYLDGRARTGAPAKANKEIALLSAVLEYGRRMGILETNHCRGIKYNRTRPKTKYVSQEALNFVMTVARERGGSLLVTALCLQFAYLTVCRPDETRHLMRQAIDNELGISVAIGKRKKGQVQRYKRIEWSPTLRAIIDDALSLQRTSSLYVFGNSQGQPYSTSGFNVMLRRLMKLCEDRSKENGIAFSRFTLAEMRPSAVTDRMEQGDTHIIDATGHTDGRMVAKVYDRRKVKVAKPTR
ncbi:tyrosine-type recombinase/integrase [Massilia sp. TS11]|uniref:tyrosine-type recombinase/integrase n=1 Tax=Massilia sp. TS11 TaxID=2908003 RepID=UPI001EDB431B|nr:tyrosine-type recombinase/integrase [Massilia sp. TS11]MCG2585975.1 tyrosine-type recombinase/integrase [Massilia sp. TS11]